MADTKKVVIDVKVKGNSADKAKDIAKELKKTKKEARATGDTFGLMNTKIGNMAKGFMSFAKVGVNSMRTVKGAVAATGIGLLLIAIVALIQYFNKTEEGADDLKKMMAALGAVISTVVDVIVSYGKFLFKVVGNIKDVVKGNKTLKESFNDSKEAAKDMGKEIVESVKGIGDAIEISIELQERENDLVKAKRANLSEEAKLTVALAREKAKINDQNLTTQQRVEAINKADDLSNNIINNKIRLAKEAYKIEKEKDAQFASTADDKLKVAELEATLIFLEAERANKAREFIGRKSGLEKAERDKKLAQARKDKEQAEVDEEEEIERTTEFNEQLRELDEENYLLTLETKEERDAQKIVNEQLAFEASLAKQKANKEITDAQYQILSDAANAIFLKKHKDLNEKIAASDKKKADEKIIADKEAADASILLKKTEQNAAIMGALSSANTILAVAGDLFGESKDMAIASATISAIQGAINAYSSAAAIPIIGTVLAPIMAGVAIAAGIANITKIKNQKGPSNKKINKKALGGDIIGASHVNGGETINAERGEFIVNKRTMANTNYASTIRALNAKGNGVQNQTSTLVSEERVAEIAAGVVRSIPVQVTEEDISDTQVEVTEREGSFSR